MSADARELVLQSNTQSSLSGAVRLSAGNFWKERYTDAEGHDVEGLTCGLWILEGEGRPQRHVRVYPGASLQVVDHRLEVLNVEPRQVRLRVSSG